MRLALVRSTFWSANRMDVRLTGAALGIGTVNDQPPDLLAARGPVRSVACLVRSVVPLVRQGSG